MEIKATAMRVLHITHQYPPAIGGSEKYIADLSEELVQRGHQVDVFTSRSLDYQSWRNELGPFEVRHGVGVSRFRSLQRRALQWRMLHFGISRYWRTRARRHDEIQLAVNMEKIHIFETEPPCERIVTEAQL